VRPRQANRAAPTAVAAVAAQQGLVFSGFGINNRVCFAVLRGGSGNPSSARRVAGSPPCVNGVVVCALAYQDEIGEAKV